MEPYENAAVQSIWQRVQSGNNEDYPTREQFAVWIGGEACDRMTCQELAKQDPKAAAEFQRAANEAAQHLRELSALCFLLHGAKPTLRPAPLPGSYDHRLRQCYSRTAHRAQDYRRAAEQWPTHAPLFRKLAAAQEELSLLLIRIAAK